ncbi:hypothetical protein F6Y05_21100 [Bacillus megaterium]|nr:hypothetical protein [Priestia megaterium]
MFEDEMIFEDDPSGDDIVFEGDADLSGGAFFQTMRYLTECLRLLCYFLLLLLVFSYFLFLKESARGAKMSSLPVYP